MDRGSLLFKDSNDRTLQFEDPSDDRGMFKYHRRPLAERASALRA